MPIETIDTLIVGGGQAGLAMSEHLSICGVPHLILERNRIAERWRSERWDSLVANGPAWHDRFPGMEFAGFGPDDFPDKDSIADYFVAYADMISAPIRCGVDVIHVRRDSREPGFLAETSKGIIKADNVVAATGPFQHPSMPTLIPEELRLEQLHSSRYRNPAQLSEGAVLVVGAGSSGVQIADELSRAGKRVYLSVGLHDRPPRRYRGRDFVWWLGVLGKWDAEDRAKDVEHVTIAVSGARGGDTVDFRRLAAQGIVLVGRTECFKEGVVTFKQDLAKNIGHGDANYLSLLDEADAYISANRLDFPEEPEARQIGPDPQCVTDPILELNLSEAGIETVIWATGYTADYSWLEADTFDKNGKPLHRRGISSVPGLYFLGLPWLSRRGSAFIWGVWHDAKFLADRIATQRKYRNYSAPCEDGIKHDTHQNSQIQHFSQLSGTESGQ